MDRFFLGQSPSIDAGAVTSISFLITDRFSILSFSAATQVLKTANDVLGRKAYEFDIVGSDTLEVTSDSGVVVRADYSLSDLRVEPRRRQPDIIYLFAGAIVDSTDRRQVSAWLRELVRRGGRIVGFDTATFWIASAGLLTGKVCTLHWESIPIFEERFGMHVEVSRDVIVESGMITTCAGQASAIDYVLHLIARDHGELVATRVSEAALVDRVRACNEPQRVPLQIKLGIANDRLVHAIECMMKSLDRLVVIDDIADAVHVSRRQLERLFRAEFGLSPSRYHMVLRMERAHLLLSRSNLSVLEIAASCGFGSPPHFSKTYKGIYGVPPQQTRQLARGAASVSETTQSKLGLQRPIGAAPDEIPEPQERMLAQAS